MKSKTKSFVKEVLARMKGDSVTATAEKNYRKATAAINGQIASLQSKLIQEESRVEEAQEALDNAKYPSEAITSDENYVKGIKDKQEAFNTAKENLDNVTESLKYYQDLLKGFDAETEVEEEKEAK